MVPKRTYPSPRYGGVTSGGSPIHGVYTPHKVKGKVFVERLSVWLFVWLRRKNLVMKVFWECDECGLCVDGVWTGLLRFGRLLCGRLGGDGFC